MHETESNSKVLEAKIPLIISIGELIFNENLLTFN